jgi:CRP/FNR family transcriptional regulator, cyclic AMP receptor protein
MESMPMRAGCFLERLTPLDRDALLATGFTRRFSKGATLINEGDEIGNVYVLLAGRVKVSVTAADGTESVLCVLGPGELLGEFEAIDLDTEVRTADNVALEALQCRVLRHVEFRTYLEEHPRAALVLLGVYVRRLRHSDRRRADVVALDAAHRVARLLIEQASAGDETANGEVEIDLPLTQHELASLASASRESVVRALTSLRNRGLVATARRRITVRDVAALREYAG